MGLRNTKLRNEKETIEALEANGIQVVMRPVALLPDNLDSLHGIGRKPTGTVETNIYEALEKLEIRIKVMGDPFSK